MMLVLASIISGAIGGMGIGGGVILIPVLTGFFDISQKNAQFINLLYFVPVALCALIIHIRRGRVDMKRGIFMALGGILGAFPGTFAAQKISVEILRKLFGYFLFVIGVTRLKKSKRERKI